MTIDDLVKAGNFAQIMRECFALLEKRHEGVPGVAYKQTVDLRAYLQSLYDAQPKSIKALPVRIAALAGIAYSWLSDGQTIEAIKAIPSLQFLEAGRKLEQTFEPYNAHYTSLSILDTSEDAHSTHTEPIQRAGEAVRFRFDPPITLNVRKVTLQGILQAMEGLSPHAPGREQMQKIVDEWAQRHGLKGSDVG